MQKIISDKKGIYVLEIFSPRTFTIQHKVFHHIKFKKGFYYYTGSGQKNLYKRIERHLKKNKKLFWHIDYITSLPFIKIFRVKIFPDMPKKFECILVNILTHNYEIIFPVKNFGNSDCRNCCSHLLYSKKKLNFNRMGMLNQPVSYFPLKSPR